MRSFPETKLAIAFNEHCLTYFPRQHGVLNYTHIANEGRSPQEGAKLKKMGVKAGFLDFEFIWNPNKTYPRLAFLDAKCGKNDFNASQKEFVSSMRAMGIPCEKFYSVQEGHLILVSLGITPIRECRIFKEPQLATWDEKLAAVHSMFAPRKDDK